MRGRDPGHARSTALTLGLLGAALVAGALGASSAGAPPPLADRPTVPQATFRVVHPDPSQRITAPRTGLGQLRGQVTVIAFLDDRCADCEAAAGLVQLFGMNQGAAALGVATGISPRQARAFATKRIGRGIRIIPMAADPRGVLARRFGVTSLPTVLVLDRRGRLAERIESPSEPERVAALVDELQDEPIPGGLAPPRTRPPLSVFRTGPRPRGPLPRSLQPRYAPCLYLPGSLRVAARSGPVRLMVARSLDGGILAAIDEGRGGLGLGCGVARFAADRRRELARMRARGIVTAFGSGARGRALYGLVVMDGYREVIAGGRRFAVQHNGVIIRGVGHPGRVVLRGPAGVRRVAIFG